MPKSLLIIILSGIALLSIAILNLGLKNPALPRNTLPPVSATVPILAAAPVTATSTVTGQATNNDADFVGAQQCRQCHAKAFAAWQQSDHAKAMQVASSATVLGNFANVELEFHSINSRLQEKDSHFFINTLNAEGKDQQFQIKYTFGHYPLQQYLVETEKGRLQALNIAWDSRPADQGGQRWYHLQPNENITPEHPFFWSGYFQNWNGRCAECHVTNYKKNYNAATTRFNSSWSDGNVACEACHGPGSTHVTLAQRGELSEAQHGFARSEPAPINWHYQKGDPIANPEGSPNSDYVNMCGRCHALRMPLAEYTANAGFHETFQLQLLHQGAYFADGQIQDEVFVLGSFLQSKMSQQGVTCSNCHDPHSGKVKIEGNGLCAQCHAPNVYDQEAHHHHPLDSSGALCVNCHMPARTYMQVDARRDHSFTIPNPALSEVAGVPNACTACHAENDNHWASKNLKRWGIASDNTHWGYVNARARKFDALAAKTLIAQATDTSNAPIVRATLLEQTGALGMAHGLQQAAALLNDANPLLRRAAVYALQAAPVEVRWQVLSPHIDDDNRNVRYAIAQSLADVYAQLPATHRPALYALLQEYRQSLAPTLDAPGTQLNLAALDLALGNRAQALQAYQRALDIAPAFVPALINLSEFYRSEGDNKAAQAMLDRALVIAPDSATVQHAYGLQLIRQKDYRGAVRYLASALDQADANPRHAYVYAVALDSLGDTNKAIEVLINASNRWPNQYDLLLTLIAYKDKSGSHSDIDEYLRVLQKIAPQSPQVQHFSAKFSNQ